MLRRLSPFAVLLLACTALPAAEPSNARKPKGDADLEYWLENMVWYHRFRADEIVEATGLTRDEIAVALKRFDIRPDNRPKRPAGAPLLVLPYPGGRHPRIGFQGGAVRPQRETKVSVFTPWDENSYVVADVPEAIWCQHGLLYLAHTHVPTVWTRQHIDLEPLEWERKADGVLEITRRLPNGVSFGARVVPGKGGVRLEQWLTNGSKEKLTDLRVQNCLMLKGAAGFTQQTGANKVHAPPYAAARSEDGKRWVIWAWEPNHRCWDNPPCPCIHSDPKFPDCAPGETRRLRGWLSFYEGDDVQAEFRRLDRLGWRDGPPQEKEHRTAAPQTAAAPAKPRLLVLTDIGGDPDDQQSMIRLMAYANEFEIEGLVASAAGTPGELKEAVTHPDLIRAIVEAYGKVRPNLLLHRPDYPSAGALLECVKTGNPRRGVNNIGAGHDTEGSRWIIHVVDLDDPRPLNVTIWGGSTDLAQALWRARNDRTAEGLKRFVGKLRVHAIGHQDDTGPWIVEQFPDLFYVLSKAPDRHDMREGAYRGMYLGGDESLTSRAWVEAHVREGCGPLGALYPTRTWTAPNPHGCLKEGDTPSWLYFLPTGLSDPAHPEWGCWGGRFRHAGGGLYRDAADTVGTVTDARATVWRWRPAFQADFAARMAWCVRPARDANHPPAPVLNGDSGVGVTELGVRPGEGVKLTAAGSSDPDGDRLTFRWFVYPEAGTYGRDVPLSDPNAESAALTVPADAGGKTIHVVLEVTDDGAPALTRYRRAVLRAGR